jgi:hypothetical protein
MSIPLQGSTVSSDGRLQIKIGLCSLFVVLALCACNPSSTQPDAVPTTVDGFSAEPVTMPLRVRPVGRSIPQDLGLIRVKADGMETRQDAVYLRVAVPNEPLALPRLTLGETWLEVMDQSAVLAVPAAQGVKPGEPWIYLRFHGPDLPHSPTISWHQRPVDGRGGMSLRIQLVDVMDTPKGENLGALFFRSASNWFRSRSKTSGQSGLPFYDFAADLAQGKADEILGSTRPQNSTDSLVDFMGLGALRSRPSNVIRTGGLSVQSASPVPDSTSKKSGGSAAALEKPAARTQRNPVVDRAWPPGGAWIKELAKFVPQDALSFFLSPGAPMESLAAVLMDFSLYFDLFEHGHRAHSALIGFAQQVTPWIRDIAPKEATGIVVYSLDPGEGMGTDLTVGTGVDHGPRAVKALAKSLARAGFTQSKRNAVMSRSIRAYTHSQTGQRVYVGRIHKYVFVGNSVRAIEAALSTAGRPSRSLADDSQFPIHVRRYAEADESAYGFLFIGFGAISRFFSAPGRLRRARHRMARAELSALEYAWQFAQYLTGEHHRDIQTLVRAGWLTTAHLTHAPDASSLVLSPTGMARSSHWGTLKYIQPIADVADEPITPAQGRAYDELSAQWTSQVGAFLHPISVGWADRGSQGRIWAYLWNLLPSNPMGYWLDEFGSTHLPILPTTDGPRATISFPRASSGRGRVLGQLSAALGQADLDFNGLGDWLAVGLGDTPGIYDVVFAFLQIPLDTGQGTASVSKGETRLQRLPVYVIIPIEDRRLLHETMARIRVATSDPSLGSWHWGSTGAHAGMEVHRVQCPLGKERLLVYYVELRDYLILALDGATLIGLINQLNSHQLASEPTLSYARFRWSRPKEISAPWLFQAMGLLYESWSMPAIRRGWLTNTLSLPVADASHGTGVPESLRNPASPAAHSYGTEQMQAWPPVPVPGSTLDGASRGLRAVDIRVQKTRRNGQGLAVDLKWIWGGGNGRP